MEKLLLTNDTAMQLYNEVRDLPIIDYHCHLDPIAIAQNHMLGCIGEIWLKADHYKWRAMRLCGVDEEYVTGNTSYKDKFVRFAECLPKLIGSPVYTWSKMELKQIFGIDVILNSYSAEKIYVEATANIKGKTVLDILQQFRVEYIATTDDPIDNLEFHGRHSGIVVAPTFRPDRAFCAGKAYLRALEIVCGYKITNIADLKRALTDRLDYFVSHNCKLSDHCFESLEELISDSEAQRIFDKVKPTNKEQDCFYTYMLYCMAGEYAKRGISMQLRFAVMRDCNSKMLKAIGADGGFDIIGQQTNLQRLAELLDALDSQDKLPRTILYSLNPNDLSVLTVLSGAFRRVQVGPAWWYNDTAGGIRKHLEAVSELAVLGTDLGMLTDSRSFSSYVRFDFFRRILASFVGEKINNGEYDKMFAAGLMQNICYNNSKELVEL